MTRPTIDQTMLEIASVLSRRATCQKLEVGCVLTNARGEILGTGYNGVPRGFPHCTVVGCGGENAPAGSDLCCAVHAEQNALQQCKDIWSIAIAYVTHPPCLRCTKDLLNTGCRIIYSINKTPKDPRAVELWIKGGGIIDFREELPC